MIAPKIESLNNKIGKNVIRNAQKNQKKVKKIRIIVMQFAQEKDLLR